MIFNEKENRYLLDKLRSGEKVEVVLQPRIWKDRSGKEIPVHQLTTTHLINIVGWLKRNRAYPHKEFSRIYIEAFVRGVLPEEEQKPLVKALMDTYYPYLMLQSSHRPLTRYQKFISKLKCLERKFCDKN